MVGQDVPKNVFDEEGRFVVHERPASTVEITSSPTAQQCVALEHDTPRKLL
jgi:hypothetical protein